MKLLFIIDMQNDFMDETVLGNPECRKIIPNIITKIMTKTYDSIIVTRDTHTSDYFHTQEGKNLPVLHCVEGTEGWKLQEDIQNALNISGIPVNYINKPSFGSIQAAAMVKKLRPQEVELTGVCTGICVISNALVIKAMNPEIPLTVDASCCACISPESHQNALNVMKLCQIYVINE